MDFSATAVAIHLHVRRDTQANPPRWGEHVNSWLTVATHAEDQLRQRVAYALSQFFVVSDQGCLGGQQAALSNYYDILIANSFGNFRGLGG